MTLGLGILTKNSEFELLDRALASVYGHVDNIYITVGDKVEPSDEIKRVADKYKAHLSYFPWINDFSAARNFNMGQCKDDWYVWMDTDDEVEGMEKAKEKLTKLAQNVSFIICTYNYAFYPSGIVSTKHPKERFIRNDGQMKWKGYLHETCVSDFYLDGGFWDDIVWNHRTTGERTLESSQRNIVIIEQEIKNQADEKKIDPRTIFNLGMAYASLAQRTMDKDDWMRAIKAFYEYLKVGAWSEHMYMAWKYIGIGQVSVGRPDLALQSYFEALKLNPAYADAYATIGSAYDRLNDIDKAEVWYKLALTEGRENTYAHDVASSTITPLASLARIYAMRGKLSDAEKYVKLALKIEGKNEFLEGLFDEIKKMKRVLNKSKKIANYLKSLPDEQAKEEWNKLSEKEKTLPEVVLFRRNRRWKKESSGKDLVIFTGQAWEEWNPDSAKTGIGGSEEAVINMAQRFKNLGWNVTVFGSHGAEPKEYDGVWYRPWWDIGIDEPVDVFIAWREPNIFEFKINAKQTYLWLHDTVEREALTPKRLLNITKVIVLSKWHRDLYPNVPDHKMFVSRNGIVPDHFKADGIERDKNKILYTSAPNRGLLCLLEMWPKIREKVPEAQLYWAYGWQTFDKAASTNPQMQAYKRAVVDKLQQEGVHELGRIGHEELAKHMLSANIWAYPTEFTEISCITAMKMQAAGAVPVCTTVAALDETVQHGIKFAVQDIYTNPEAQQQFIDKIVELLTNDYPHRQEMIDWALSFYDWDTVANEWNNEFQLCSKK